MPVSLICEKNHKVIRHIAQNPASFFCIDLCSLCVD